MKDKMWTYAKQKSNYEMNILLELLIISSLLCISSYFADTFDETQLS